MEKTLIAYFTWSGNTETVARMIQEITGGDMFRIETKEPYPDGYSATTEVAKEELRGGARPPLTDQVSDMGSYDTVFLGYPNWWGTVPMAVCTFLESYDLSGKIIVPFCTHGGGGAGRGSEDIRKLCPHAKVESAFSVYADSAKKDDVEKWLNNYS